MVRSEETLDPRQQLCTAWEAAFRVSTSFACIVIARADLDASHVKRRFMWFQPVPPAALALLFIIAAAAEVFITEVVVINQRKCFVKDRCKTRSCDSLS